ncbi:MAG: hypothetical protein LUH16_00205 [Clostridiales bacterium]|nr:hypothetical protein [Clostridiales bacterium]
MKMTDLIEKGRQNRFVGAVVHMLVFLAFYLLYLLILATMGTDNPFYPFDWAANRGFLFYWVPVLVVRLLNYNIAAGCMTTGYFLGLILSIPVNKLTYQEIPYDSGVGFYTTMYEFYFWFCVVVISIVVGIVGEMRYRKKREVV